MQFYVINLDQSVQRWAEISRSGTEAGLRLTRIAAVQGSAVPRDKWQDIDERRFYLAHGRGVLPGEYGCYRSHLAALDAFIASGEMAGVVCEDDIVLNGSIVALVEAVLSERPDLHALKLVNHRVKGFVRHGGSGTAIFGRCVHGPQGSAAAYAVTRDGAQLLRQALATAWLPYDVALERGWATGARIFTLKKAGVRFQPVRPRSTIQAGESYRRSKPLFLKRAPAALFRGSDYLRRARYAIR